MTGEEWAAILGGVAATVTAVGGVVAVLVRGYLERIKIQITDVHKQVHPNGGSSILDTVRRIEETASRNGRAIALVRGDLHSVREDLTTISRRVDHHLQHDHEHPAGDIRAS